MWHVIVCDGDGTERNQLTEYVKRYFDEQGIDGRTESCCGWPELAGELKQGKPDLVIVAQDGVEGLDTITSARLPAGRIVWFSDLDFSIQAYRLCVDYFGKKPVTYRKIEWVLKRFMTGTPSCVS